MRVRQVGTGAVAQWRQTFKIGATGLAALCEREEWEAPVSGPAPSSTPLALTPWRQIDPDGRLFTALAPCFTTAFERTRWLVRMRNGSRVEVALDIGQIRAGHRHAPICELELELLAGRPEVLFEVARHLARSIAVLPMARRKSDRGYALAHGELNAPRCARPSPLAPDLPLPRAAQQVLREMFGQFIANLDLLRASDDSEVVHQAQVGWRRFRSAWRLLKPAFAPDAAVPPWRRLQALMKLLGELRDLDVARMQTFPALDEAYMAGSRRCPRGWQALEQTLRRAAASFRNAVRQTLEHPEVGQALLEMSRWLAFDVAAYPARHPAGLPKWAGDRLARLHHRLRRAQKGATGPDSLHRVRIPSKRMRYGLEVLGSFLPRKRAMRWHRQATGLQTTLGASRDVAQAHALAIRHRACGEVVDFLLEASLAQGPRNSCR